MLFSTASRLVKKALYLLQYGLVELSNNTYKYKLNGSRTFSKDAQTDGALCDLASDIVLREETPLD